MAKYIDKDAVLAEIDKRIEVLQKHPMENHKTICHLDSVKQSVNSLEVKEVDLDTDFGVCWGEYCDCCGNINDYEVAKHFFELGMQQSKNYNNNGE